MKNHFIFLALICFMQITHAASINEKIYAYVSNNYQIYQIDVDRDENMGTVIPINDQAWSPSEIVISPNNQLAYVINDGSDQYPAFANVAIVDTHTNRQIGILDGLKKDAIPITIAISPTGKYGYIGEITQPRMATVEIFDASNSVIDSVKNFDHRWIPQKIVFTPDAKKAIVVLEPKLNFPKILIIDTATHSVIKQINDAKHDYEDVVISPDSKTAYFASSFNKKEIMLLDLKTNTIIGRFGIYDDIYHYPTAMAITPAGDKVYIIDTTPVVSIFDTKLNKYVGGLDIQHPEFSYYHIKISPTGNKGYLTGTNGLTVFDTSTDKELSKINIGSHDVAFFKDKR